MTCYLDTGEKPTCYGCESCVQACAPGALSMSEDVEGFRYPAVDAAKCVSCWACRLVCPYEHPPARSDGNPTVTFGGHHRDPLVLEASTSGGAFSALLEGWFKQPGEAAAFGAVAHGLDVRHEAAFSLADTAKFRKSKYSQSVIGGAFGAVAKMLGDGYRVLFSGTPCQVAGLKAYLKNASHSPRLLTVEVVCEGVPSPLYMRAYDKKMLENYGSGIAVLDYRFKDGRRWDFEVMSTSLQSGHHFKEDRWFNAFWYVWLDHLMSRPSCYACPFATRERVADITLGDLWGVHIYCPDLYACNAGASLVVCNTDTGVVAFGDALPYLEGRQLDFEEALKYQGPMRCHIKENPHRGEFMTDLQAMSYDELNGKWSKGPSLKLLLRKYMWGNRQKVAIWNARRLLGLAAPEKLGGRHA